MPKTGAMPDTDSEVRVTRLTVYPVKGLAGQWPAAPQSRGRGRRRDDLNFLDKLAESG